MHDNSKYPAIKQTCRTCGTAALALLLFAVSAAGTAFSRTELRTLQSEQLVQSAAKAPLYLPSVRHVRLITLGFDRFAADILWFNTLNYFGKQYETERDYRWLGHMCDLVSSLAPKEEHVYEFCATLLAWVAREPEQSNHMLTKAIEHQADYWRYYYLRGFNYWYFLEEKDLAQKDLEHASRLPGAPAIIASLASRLMVDRDDTQTAIAFLQDLVEHSEDEAARSALKERLNMAHVSNDLRLLREKIKEFEAKTGRTPQEISELAAAGLLPGIPLDPWGAPYIIDLESGEPKPSKGRRALAFKGKTAKTGAASRFR